MKSIIKNIARQFLLLLLVVQTLNLSINSIDFYKASKIANTVDNQDYVDSIIEFLVENVLGYSKNTFHDKANANNNTKQNQNIAHFDLKCFPDSLNTFNFLTFQKDVDYIIHKNDKVIILFCEEVRPNPPQSQSV